MNLQSDNIKDIIHTFVFQTGYIQDENIGLEIVNNIYELTKIKNPIDWNCFYNKSRAPHIMYAFFKQYKTQIPLYKVTIYNFTLNNLHLCN